MSLFWRGFEKRAYLAKRPYKQLDATSVDPGDKSTAWTAKIDGAHAIVDLKVGELPKIYGHRMSKRTGGAIEYTDKLTHLKRPSPVSATVRAEVFAVDSAGKAVHPDVITALLNRSPDKAKELLKEKGLKTQTALIDIDKLDGEDVSNRPFSWKRKVLGQLAKQNKDFTLPQIAVGAKAKTKLLDRIRAGEHPQTREGVVVHQLAGFNKAFAKAKLTNDYDVYVRRVFREEGTKGGRAPMAGGFYYSWTPGGEPVGKVGTGFDHKTKQDMLVNPEKYLGQVARIKAHDLSKNKVLVKPSFLGWHVDKNIGRANFDPTLPGRTSTVFKGEPKKDRPPNGGFLKQTVVVSKKIATNEAQARELARPYAEKLDDVFETGQSWRFRQAHPAAVKPGTYKTFNPRDGVALVLGEAN